MFASLALFGNCDIPSYVTSFQTSAPILVPVAKAVVSFPFIFHYAAGLRHLYWDYTAKGIDLDSQFNSSRIIMGTTGVLTLLAAIYTI